MCELSIDGEDSTSELSRRGALKSGGDRAAAEEAHGGGGGKERAGPTKRAHSLARVFGFWWRGRERGEEEEEGLPKAEIEAEPSERKRRREREKRTPASSSSSPRSLNGMAFFVRVKRACSSG